MLQINVSTAFLIVLLTGFEPVIFAVRGRRPRPLDDRSLNQIFLVRHAGNFLVMVFAEASTIPSCAANAMLLGHPRPLDDRSLKLKYLPLLNGCFCQKVNF